MRDNAAMTARILVVDDDTALAEMIGIVLEREALTAHYCTDGAKALGVIAEYNPDLILLDVMLPGMDGIEICRRVRESSGVPIIMLTARSDTEDVVRGLEAGADDYIPKPFKPAELIARVRARLRRSPEEAPAPQQEEKLMIGDLEIDVSGHEVRRGEKVIALTPLEFDLIAALARSPWKVFTREELLEQVWGYRHAADTRLVNVHVQRLRAKVEIDPEHPQVVVTVRGVGYRSGNPQA